MADSPPLLFVGVLGKLAPANDAAAKAMRAIGRDQVVVKITKATRNQRRRSFYWTMLDVASEVFADTTGTPWDAETLHDELRKSLRFGVELKTPSGRVIWKPQSTSDKSLTEVDRARWTDRVATFLSRELGVPIADLMEEVRSRNEPQHHRVER